MPVEPQKRLRKTARSAGQRSGEPRFSRQAPDVRRQQILDAAERCLAKGGVAAFTVSKICAEADISHGLINHYFTSKEALLVATYERVAERLAKATRRALGHGLQEPEGKLRAVVETSFSGEIFNESFLAVWLALWAQVRNHPELRQAHNALYDTYRHQIARVIGAVAERRGRAVDAWALALAFTALVDGLWLEWCLDPKVFAPDDAKRACYRLLEGTLGSLGSLTAVERAAVQDGSRA